VAFFSFEQNEAAADGFLMLATFVLPILPPNLPRPIAGKRFPGFCHFLELPLLFFIGTSSGQLTALPRLMNVFFHLTHRRLTE
jgi:hypothetical protein